MKHSQALAWCGVIALLCSGTGVGEAGIDSNSGRVEGVRQHVQTEQDACAEEVRASESFSHLLRLPPLHLPLLSNLPWSQQQQNKYACSPLNQAFSDLS